VLLSYETLALAYAAALAVGAALAPAGRRARGLLASGALAACVLAVAASATAASATAGWRLLAPHVYLLLGYWAPALLVRRAAGDPHLTPFETWLARTDAVLRPRMPAVPPRIVALTELAYLGCYPLVPLSFVLVWSRGTPLDLERFWLSVLASGYVCYGTLPWLPSRPPRMVGARAPEPRGVRAINARVLGRLSHGWNTFPSGHVAIATMSALAVWQVWPAAGVLVGVLAAAVAAGAAAGRYHYVVDVFAGALVAALLAMVTW
jgi:membrane-associated phospholipid phosphatase